VTGDDGYIYTGGERERERERCPERNSGRR